MRSVIWFFFTIIFTFLCFCFSLKTLTETGYEKYNEVTCLRAVAAERGGVVLLHPSCLPGPGTTDFCPGSGKQGFPVHRLGLVLSCLRRGLTVTPWPAALVGSVSTCSAVPLCCTPHRSQGHRGDWTCPRPPVAHNPGSDLPRGSEIHWPEQIFLSCWNVVWPWPMSEPRRQRQLLGGAEPWPCQRPTAVLTATLWTECER